LPLPQVKATEPWFGLEQEYTMLNRKTQRVYGWPEQGYPAPQGPFYCGVGAESVFGRPLAEAHMEACMKAGLNISGINAEVRGYEQPLLLNQGQRRPAELAVGQLLHS
jgi:glutamine synthetase